tara:strand:+ start:46 stop:345 length:300 start_codon:yes stop_codon:yes gene_type:complete
MDLNTINKEVRYTEKTARSNSYGTMRDASRYTTEVLLEFKKSIAAIVYTIDNRIDKMDFALALSYILADEYSHTNSLSTREMLQTIENLVAERSEDLAE